MKCCVYNYEVIITYYLISKIMYTFSSLDVVTFYQVSPTHSHLNIINSDIIVYIYIYIYIYISKMAVLK